MSWFVAGPPCKVEGAVVYDWLCCRGAAVASALGASLRSAHHTYVETGLFRPADADAVKSGSAYAFSVCPSATQQLFYAATQPMMGDILCFYAHFLARPSSGLKVSLISLSNQPYCISAPVSCTCICTAMHYITCSTSQ